MATETRFKALDGLRAIAVSQVVIYHYYLIPLPPGKAFGYLERLLAAIDGVTLFFALSGYLIGGILLSTKGREGAFKVFYARRFFRIVPLYFLLLASYAAVWALDAHFRLGLIYFWYSTDIPRWSYAVFAQNFWMAQLHALGPLWLVVTWSLAVEQQFYLLAPWLVRWLQTGALLTVAVAALVAAAFRPMPDNYLLVDRMDALAAGLILAILAHEPCSRAWLQRRRGALRWVVGIYFAAFLTQHLAGPLVDRLAVRWLTSLACALAIHLLADEAPWPVVKPAIAWLAPLGLLSYCIYLFHFPVLYLTQTFIGPSKELALLLTVGFAALSHRYFEKPLIEYGHRFRYGERSKAA